MSSRSKFRIDDVKKLKDELVHVPPEEIREISKREAIALLGPEIPAMRSNGYSFERIAERLTSGGIPIRTGHAEGIFERGARIGQSQEEGIAVSEPEND